MSLRDGEPRSTLESATVGVLWVVAGAAWFLALLWGSDCATGGTRLLVLLSVGGLASFAGMGLTNMRLSSALAIAIALSGAMYVVLVIVWLGHCGN